jgi:hypothetical protein
LIFFAEQVDWLNKLSSSVVRLFRNWKKLLERKSREGMDEAEETVDLDRMRKRYCLKVQKERFQNENDL